MSEEITYSVIGEDGKVIARTTSRKTAEQIMNDYIDVTGEEALVEQSRPNHMVPEGSRYGKFHECSVSRVGVRGYIENISSSYRVVVPTTLPVDHFVDDSDLAVWGTNEDEVSGLYAQKKIQVLTSWGIANE